MSTELSPCPFCGCEMSDDIDWSYSQNDDGLAVECPDCETLGPMVPHKESHIFEKAIALWNERQ